MSHDVTVDGVQYVPDESDTGGLPPGYLSPHFRESEFTCNHCNSLEGNEVPQELLRILEDVRRHFGGAPVIINSGYRCRIHNTAINSNESSRHRYPREEGAADIVVSGIAPSEVHSYLVAMYPGVYGIGRYDSFTHVDNRPAKARW